MNSFLIPRIRAFKHNLANNLAGFVILREDRRFAGSAGQGQEQGKRQGNAGGVRSNIRRPIRKPQPVRVLEMLRVVRHEGTAVHNMLALSINAFSCAKECRTTDNRKRSSPRLSLALNPRPLNP
jgi:hypothetical protein